VQSYQQDQSAHFGVHEWRLPLSHAPHKRGRKKGRMPEFAPSSKVTVLQKSSKISFMELAFSSELA
jgi:hypothetical protein